MQESQTPAALRAGRRRDPPASPAGSRPRRSGAAARRRRGLKSGSTEAPGTVPGHARAPARRPGRALPAGPGWCPCRSGRPTRCPRARRPAHTTSADAYLFGTFEVELLRSGGEPIQDALGLPAHVGETLAQHRDLRLRHRGDAGPSAGPVKASVARVDPTLSGRRDAMRLPVAVSHRHHWSSSPARVDRAVADVLAPVGAGDLAAPASVKTRSRVAERLPSATTSRS